MNFLKYNTLPNEAKEIRTKVFIEEQGFKDEFDWLDSNINHLVMFKDKKAIGTCRFYFDESKKVWIFGRLAIIKEYRGKNFGSQLVEEAEKYIKKENGKEIWLHAQTTAVNFYSKLGYKIFGVPDYDEHCLHCWMKKVI